MRNLGRLLLAVLAAGAVLGPGPCTHHDDDHTSSEHYSAPDAALWSPFDPTAVNCGLSPDFDAGVLTNGLPAACVAGEVLLAPQIFERSPGPPQEVHRSFTGNPGGDVCIDVANSGVASATVELDGRDVFGPSDFNPAVAHLQARKTIGPGNHELEVEVRSAPGSTMTVSVARAVNPPPLPPGVLAQGPLERLQLTAINADPRGISPKNQDGKFDFTALSAALRVLVPVRFDDDDHERASHTYRVDYRWKVASDTCGVVRTMAGTSPIALPPSPPPPAEEDSDSHPPDGEHGSSTSSSSSSSSSSGGGGGQGGGDGQDNSGPNNNNGHHNDGSSSGSLPTRNTSSSSSETHNGGGENGSEHEHEPMVWVPFTVAGLWDGKDDAQGWVPDGNYRIFLEAVVIRTDLENDDDIDNDGVPDREEDRSPLLQGTSHGGNATEPPEEHLVDGLVSPFVPVLVDNTPPPLTFDLVPDCTAATTVSFSGTSEAGAVVTITMAGVSTDVTTAVDGTWSAFLMLPANTTSAFSITARDALYNVAVGPTGRIIQDNIPPVLAVTDPLDNAIVADPVVHVKGSASDVNMYYVQVNDTVLFNNWASFDVPVTVPPVGLVTITAYAEDCAGNHASVVRHVQHSSPCTSSRECDELVLAQPDIACQQFGECNTDGKCEFKPLVGPSTFCLGQNLWKWTCEIKHSLSASNIAARQWTCTAPDAGDNGLSPDTRHCGMQVGCVTTQCVPGLDACQRTPVADGLRCAPGGDSVPPVCVGPNSIREPFCEAGRCISDSDRISPRSCADEAPTPQTDCWDTPCVTGALTQWGPNVVGGQCAPTAKTGQRCGQCSGPGAATITTPDGKLACDLCGKPNLCTADGWCEPSPPVSCLNSTPCTTSWCNPWTGDCVAPQPVCPVGTSCTPAADGGPICQ